MGPAIATGIILNSTLKERFDLLHLDTRANKTLQGIGKWSIGKLFRYFALYVRMCRILVFKRPDLVLIPISQSTIGYLKDFFFIALARITGTKVIVQLRGSNFQNWLEAGSALNRAFVKWSLRRCQAVIVLGNKLKPLFQDIFEENKIFVVPNGGNYELSFSVKQNDPIRILYLGNLQASKGIEDVIHAISKLEEKYSGKFQLDVVGNWRAETTRTLCMEIVEERKLPVHFHPPAEGKDKMNYLSSADIFVFTPRAPEGHPWVIVEAMAAGLPIISTDRGAIIESVREGENGFIVEAGNAEAIAMKLESLIADKERREKMAAKSRSLYEQNFTEEKMVENLASVFDKILMSGK
jgi:glycosyltransferase involved in cell wall biosynthesis